MGGGECGCERKGKGNTRSKIKSQVCCISLFYNILQYTRYWFKKFHIDLIYCEAFGSFE